MKRLIHITALSAVALIFFTGIFSPTECYSEDKIEVTLKTSMGNIVLELNREKAPITVANFLQYLNDGFYDGTIFHRVVNGPFFIIQGGGLDEYMNRKATRSPIVNESYNGLSNTAHTIAMARTSQPDSATSQFFINFKDNSAAFDRTEQNPGYAVFGRVIQGTDVVEAIGTVRTMTISGYNDVPAKTIYIGDGGGSSSDDSTCFLGTLLK